MYMFILILCIFTSLNAQGKRSLFEEDLELIDMKFSLPTEYSMSDNERPVYVTDDYNSPLRRLGTVHSVLTHSDEHCKVFVYILGADMIRYGGLVKANQGIFGEMSSLTYNRVKNDFRYGHPNSSASEQDIEDLKMMMTFYPTDTARVLFNADWMMTYPYNMEGEKYEDNFTRMRAVVIQKNKIDVFIYFMMTDKGVEDFDKYLMGLKEAFWFL